MVTSALVVTFTGPASEPLLRSALEERGLGNTELTCGVPLGPHLPAVLSSSAARAGADLLRELEALDCVEKVDVIAIDFGAGLDVDQSSEE